MDRYSSGASFKRRWRTTGTSKGFRFVKNGTLSNFPLNTLRLDTGHLVFWAHSTVTVGTVGALLKPENPKFHPFSPDVSYIRRATATTGVLLSTVDKRLAKDHQPEAHASKLGSPATKIWKRCLSSTETRLLAKHGLTKFPPHHSEAVRETYPWALCSMSSDIHQNMKSSKRAPKTWHELYHPPRFKMCISHILQSRRTFWFRNSRIPEGSS